MKPFMVNTAQRNLRLDLLRILATLMILTAHLTVIIYERSDFFGKSFWWFNHVVLSFCRMGTPLFFLLSGYLLATKKRTFSQMVQHTWLRLGIPLIGFYLLSNWAISFIHTTPFLANYGTDIWLGGGNYLYFLTSLIILYLLTPYLQRLFNTFLSFEMKNLIFLLLGNTALFTLGAYLLSSDGQVPNPTFLYWFLTSGFFLFGMWLRLNPSYVQSTRFPKLNLLIISPILFNIFFSYLMQREYLITQNQHFLKLGNYLQSYLGFTVVLASLTLFRLGLALTLPRWVEKARSTIVFFARQSFGIYLLHMILLEFFLFRTPLTLDHGPFNPAVMLVLIWLSLVIGSLAITVLLRRIPYLRIFVGETARVTSDSNPAPSAPTLFTQT